MSVVLPCQSSGIEEIIFGVSTAYDLEAADALLKFFDISLSKYKALTVRDVLAFHEPYR